MRKLWFAHLAAALVVFPGGFGTLDEMTEILTLMQTRKLERRVPVVIYGTQFWNEVIDFQALARHGVIAPEDLELFRYADSPQAAFDILMAQMTPPPERKTPAFTHSAAPPPPDGTDAAAGAAENLALTTAPPPEPE
jgi:predicted Rossmann-fold nucleotide-binding protein